MHSEAEHKISRTELSQLMSIDIGDVETLLDSPQTQPLRTRTKIQINAITTDGETSKCTCKRVVFHGRNVPSKFNLVCETPILVDKVFSAFRDGKDVNAIGYFPEDEEKDWTRIFT